ncbi:glycosyl hydrolase 5 family protein-like [Humulus lupulus]|uniref:glycosyl hydrolase 5 family protein-like n=1 Tax=Humulus lupulus TaxID=3486 RepID=UPI002B4033A2|nr:glycosyl hydrolase 5 family protein-like [Humulus lupulus]
MGSFPFLSPLSLVTIIIVTATQGGAAFGVPLSTKSRWVVEESSGQRVKMACANWVSHPEAGVAEGLSKQPIDAIVDRISSMGFNCVRLTWPLYLATTNDSLAVLTVRQSFKKLGLTQAIAGVQANNPSIIDLSLIQAYQAVVSGLGNKKVMVILDNYITKPNWFDDNGFIGDKYFDPNLWIKGLTRMATLFKGLSNVVGMSLRNELRGPKQNVNDWYKCMQRGAEAVHSANPDVLLILSGLNHDKDLSFLRNRLMSLTFSGKLVFETHWYAFTDDKAWESGNPNQLCGTIINKIMRQSGFLLEKGFPLFLSEFWVDQNQKGTNMSDNRYLNCFLALAAELDLDWALGRQGVIGMNEDYGIMNWDWDDESPNSSLLQKISAIQRPFRGRSLSETRPHKSIFHPSTGLCVVRKSVHDSLKLGPCSSSDGWNYTPQKTLTIKGTYFCLQAYDVGKPARLSIKCTESDSKWETISDSKLQLSSTTPNGDTVCLDIDSANEVVTNTCKCLSRESSCDPSSQWFKLVDSTRSP